ncbi:MAG: SURF1 family protein [Rhodopila sp.]
MTPKIRRLIGPALTAAIGTFILLGLGTWQVYRLQWKLGVLAQIDAGERGAPAPLGSSPAPYSKVSVTGRFLFDKAAFYGAEVGEVGPAAVMGAQQIVPLERPGAPPVLVDRGWIPQPTPAATPATVQQPAGQVTVVGYVRPGEAPHWFTPAPDLAERHFYVLNTEAIGLALGLPPPAPFVIIALGPAQTGIYPIPAQHLPRPPNNHLIYAITWYGLAVACVVMFIVWARKQPAT